jgi:predicted transcriptional regulator
MTDGANIRPSALFGLSLARYILVRLIDNHERFEKVAEDFDNDPQFISSIIDFLKDIKWIEQDLESGSYQLTEKGKIELARRE